MSILSLFHVYLKAIESLFYVYVIHAVLFKCSGAIGHFGVLLCLIFIRMVSHLDSLSNRGTVELGNGL